MWLRWNVQLNAIAGFDGPAIEHDAHDSSRLNAVPRGILMTKHRRQPILEVIDLWARLPQPGQLDDGAVAKPQACARRECVEVETLGRDVVTELAGAYLVSALSK